MRMAALPSDPWVIGITVILGALFAVRYVLNRRTWAAPLLFAVLTALLITPVFFSIDLWREVPSWRPLLLGLILSFFAVSPVLEWLERRRIEAISERTFRKSAHEIGEAFSALASEKIGALLAIEREDSLANIIKTGIPLNGNITKEVLATLFTPYTPTHDGGIIVSDNKITSCGCIFPLSGNDQLSSQMGTRHRAGLGLSEKSDALVIIASEETGDISMASYGKLDQEIHPPSLAKKILKELAHTQHKSKFRAPMLSRKRLRISKRGALAGRSLSFSFHLLLASAFFLSLFRSFFPIPVRDVPWVQFPHLTDQPWGWIFSIPLLVSLLLTLALTFNSKILFHPELREVERLLTFLGIPLLKRRLSYEKMRGLEVLSSREWKNLFELRLFKNRSRTWLILESRRLAKLEEIKTQLDPPRSPSNFGKR